MALKAENINTLEDMQNYVEGVINDYEVGISTKKETLSFLKDYTFRVLELCNQNKFNHENNC